VVGKEARPPLAVDVGQMSPGRAEAKIAVTCGVDVLPKKSGDAM
jgi:hypothetical protein